MKQQYTIGGMHCTNCARTIEKSVLKLAGVREVRVNFAAQKMLIDQSNLPNNEIISVVKKAGYEAEIYDDKITGRSRDKNEMKLRRKMIVSVILSMPLIYFMIAPLADAQFGMHLMPVVSLVIATFVQFVIGLDFYKGMMAALRKLTFNMDSLIAIGTSVAYIFSLVSMAIGSSEMYFEVSVLLITFVVFGRWLEARATARASSAIYELMNLRPKTAQLSNGQIIPVDNIRPGDKLLIKPGGQIPIDGRIVHGQTAIDESMVTGESMPIDKKKGDKVIGATINGSGSIEIVAEKVGSNTMLGRIIKLIEEAQSSKAPIENLTDKISSVFVPVVLIIAIATFLFWYFGLGAELSFSILTSVSVVVIACPCALGLATPTAVMVGIGQGSKYGILIKGGEPLQKLSGINTVVFDKTGTLTKGQPKVTDIVEVSKSKNQILEVAASLENASEHSLAQAILKKARDSGIKIKPIHDFRSIPGRGIEAKVGRTKYYLGNLKYSRMSGLVVSKEQLSVIKSLEYNGKTVVMLTSDREILGIIAIADRPRPTSYEAIDILKRMKITPYILSGDNERAVRALASELGVENIEAEVLPQEKNDIVKKLQKEGKRVAFVGDGINDAPALAQSDVGIAMGSGTDVAIESGDVVLVKADPRDVASAIRLSKATVAKIYQNLFFSLFYNVMGIPIAAGVFSSIGLLLKPEIAGLAMALSSVSVVLNSLLLRSFRPNPNSG